MSKRKPNQTAARPAKAGAPPAAALAEVRATIERREARAARQQEAQAAAARRRRRAQLRMLALASLVVLVVGGLLAAALLRAANQPGEAVGAQPSPHIPALDTPHAAYSTDPPTSGPHVSQVPAWGVAATPVAKELQVHALEDGGVIVHYQDTLDAATVKKLQGLTAGYSREVILNLAPGLSSPIVLTAWGRMQRFTQYDEAGIRRFIDALRGVDHHQESGS